MSPKSKSKQTIKKTSTVSPLHKEVSETTNKLANDTEKSSQKKWYVLVPLCLTAIVFFLCTKNDFVNLDDELYITLNKWITSLSAENIKLMFSEFLGGNYHPLVSLTNAIEYALAGGKHNASVYHWGNYIIHLVNTYLVYVFIYKLSNKNLLVAAIVATLFGIHPMHVESVAWISERKDVLYSLFFLAALIQYINFKEQTSTKAYVFSILLFLLSCLSKSMAVTLPLVLILIDQYKYNAWRSTKALMHKAPFFIVALIFGVVALKSQQAQGYIAEYNFNFIQKIFIASYSICFYILKLFVPVKLACLHPYPKGVLPAVYYVSILGVAALFFGVWKSKNYKALLQFGLLFFFFTIILVLQFISVGAAVVSERYTYIPYIGVFFILAQFVYKIKVGEVQHLKAFQNTIIPITGIFIVLMSVISFNRIAVWKDGESLWRDCTQKYPETADYAWFGLGNILKAKYDKPDSLREGEPKPLKEEIINAYNKCISINPDFPNYYINSSAAKSDFGDKQTALKELNKALNLNPQEVQALHNRGGILDELGDYNGAIKDFTNIIKINPEYVQAYFLRALTYKKTNQLDLAVADNLKTIALDPNFLNAYNNLANVYAAQQDFKQAVVYYDKCLALNANQANVYMNRGVSKLNMSDKVGACNDFKIAQQLGDPGAKDAILHLCQ